MLYGVEAQVTAPGSPVLLPPGSLTGVYLDGTVRLDLTVLSHADSPNMTTAVWLRSNWSFELGGPQSIINPVWMIDVFNQLSCFGGQGSWIGGQYYSTGGTNYFEFDTDTGWSDNVWQHFIMSVETNFSAGNKRAAIYIGRTLYGNQIFDTDPSFSVACNAKPLAVGSSGFKYYTGDMADLMFWPGLSLLNGGGSIDSADLDNFITTGGDPVSPSVAIAAYGSPAICLAGNATNFPLNALGTDGALTVSEGALADST